MVGRELNLGQVSRNLTFSSNKNKERSSLQIRGEYSFYMFFSYNETNCQLTIDIQIPKS